MSFQNNAFQGNAFQMRRARVAQAAGKINKRLRRNTRVKARADELAEKYKAALARQLPAQAIERIVKPYSREATLEDVFELPKIETIDFAAMARDTKTRSEFLKIIKQLAEQEEEEMALIMILAAL